MLGVGVAQRFAEDVLIFAEGELSNSLMALAWVFRSNQLISGVGFSRNPEDSGQRRYVLFAGLRFVSIYYLGLFLFMQRGNV